MAADAGARVPAWKRLGLKLAKEPSSLSSTEQTPKPTPNEKKRKHTASPSETLSTEAPSTRTASKTTEPPLKRKKSVTFASDVKPADGSATDSLLTSYVAAQTGATDDEFTPEEAAQYVVPKAHPGNEPGFKKSAGDKARKKAERNRRREEELQRQRQQDEEGEKLPPVLAYLKQFHEDRGNWKFNKNVQNVLFKNLYSPERVPAGYEEHLTAYLQTLQGASAKERLAEAAAKVIVQEDGKDVDMDDPAVRERARNAALDRHLLDTKVRLREAADAQTADSAAFERRMFARERALKILRRFEEFLPSRKRPLEEELDEKVGAAAGAERPAKRRVRVRKSRTGIDEDDESDVSDVDGQALLEGGDGAEVEDSGDDSSSVSSISSSSDDSSDGDDSSDSSSEESEDSSDDSSSDDE